MLSRADDPVDDFYTSLRPRAALRYETERGRVEASGELDSRMYRDLSDLNAVNREFAYDSSFRLTRRLAAFSSGQYRFLEDTDPAADGGELLSAGRPNFLLLTGSGGLQYALSARSTATLSASFSEFDFGRGDAGSSSQRDSDQSSYSLAFDRRLSARDSLSLSLSRTDSAFDSAPNSPSSESTSSSLELAWGRTWSSRWSSRFSGGFQYLESDASSATPSDFSPADTATSFVGSASLQRTSKRSSFGFNYSRQIRPSSGFGTDLSIDSLSGSFQRRLSRRWTLQLTGSWSLLRSATDQAFFLQDIGVDPQLLCALFGGTFATRSGGVISCVSDSAVDSETRSFGVALSWQASQHWSAFLRYSFREQINQGDDFRLGDFDKHMLSLGFRYRYDLDLL